MIRKAQSHDIETLTKLWYEVNINTHDFISQQYWLEQLPNVKEAFNKAEIYVYEKDEHITGFIGLQDNYIAGIFVALKEQSAGIGQKLLSYVKKHQEMLTLKVYQKNLRAINFYQNNGFKIQNESRDEANNEDEYIMEWYK